MKKQLVSFMCIAVLLFGCKKEDSSSSTTTTSNNGGNNGGGGGSTSNYVIDDFIGKYSGVLTETITPKSGSNPSTLKGQKTIEFVKLSATQIKFSVLTGDFSNGKIVFPKQKVYIGSYAYNASGTAELASADNLKMHLDFADGANDSRVQEYDMTKE